MRCTPVASTSSWLPLTSTCTDPPTSTHSFYRGNAHRRSNGHAECVAAVGIQRRGRQASSATQAVVSDVPLCLIGTHNLDKYPNIRVPMPWFRLSDIISRTFNDYFRCSTLLLYCVSYRWRWGRIHLTTGPTLTNLFLVYGPWRIVLGTQKWNTRLVFHSEVSDGRTRTERR